MFVTCNSAVRSAMLFAVCMLLLVVPSHVLLDDLQQDALELKTWLEGTSSWRYCVAG